MNQQILLNDTLRLIWSFVCKGLFDATKYRLSIVWIDCFQEIWTSNVGRKVTIEDLDRESGQFESDLFYKLGRAAILTMEKYVNYIITPLMYVCKNTNDFIKENEVWFWYIMIRGGDEEILSDLILDSLSINKHVIHIPTIFYWKNYTKCNNFDDFFDKWKRDSKCRIEDGGVGKKKFFTNTYNDYQNKFLYERLYKERIMDEIDKNHKLAHPKNKFLLRKLCYYTIVEEKIEKRLKLTERRSVTLIPIQRKSKYNSNHFLCITQAELKHTLLVSKNSTGKIVRLLPIYEYEKWNSYVSSCNDDTMKHQIMIFTIDYGSKWVDENNWVSWRQHLRDDNKPEDPHYMDLNDYYFLKNPSMYAKLQIELNEIWSIKKSLQDILRIKEQLIVKTNSNKRNRFIETTSKKFDDNCDDNVNDNKRIKL